jgi:hypothetical protein
MTTNESSVWNDDYIVVLNESCLLARLLEEREKIVRTSERRVIIIIG